MKHLTLLSLVLLALTLGCGKADNGGAADGGDGDADTDNDSDSDVDTGFDPADLEWVEIEGGTFMMGADDGENNQAPAHEVTVPTFEIMRTETTVEMFRGCVDDGACDETEPGDWEYGCNWFESDRDQHPIDCLSWFQADDFCDWIGARLTSEAEWEYAARSRGQDVMYPWGDTDPSCDVVIYYDWDLDDAGCGSGSTWPVCSKPDGNTEQGLCDMAGNASEHLEDLNHLNYEGAPTDGSAWTESDGMSNRMLRGGNYTSSENTLECRHRSSTDPDYTIGGGGVRCARSVD